MILLNAMSGTKRPVRNMGPVVKKVLLLLYGGAALAVTRRPDAYFRITKEIVRQWRRINERSLRDAIRKLYQSKLVSCHVQRDGTVQLMLTEEGKRRVVQFHPESMRIQKPQQWDGLWRMVFFDIPESKKKGRDALSTLLKRLEFYPMQKSVFVHPFECKDEVNFVTEMFGLVPYVRFVRVKDIDIALDLKRRFALL